jgi:hypothetical protein
MDTLGAFYQAGNMVFQTCEEATMSTERREWTKLVEQREREKKVKRPRTKKQPETAPAELEVALDDLVGEAERGAVGFGVFANRALDALDEALIHLDRRSRGATWHATRRGWRLDAASLRPWAPIWRERRARRGRRTRVVFRRFGFPKASPAVSREGGRKVRR